MITEPQRVLDVFRAAAEAIRRNGWRTTPERDADGRFATHDDRRTLVEAIEWVVPWDGHTPRLVFAFLRRRVGTHDLVSWNDADGRTVDDVLAVLEADAQAMTTSTCVICGNTTTDPPGPPDIPRAGGYTCLRHRDQQERLDREARESVRHGTVHLSIRPDAGHNHTGDRLREPSYPLYRDRCPMGCDDIPAQRRVGRIIVEESPTCPTCGHAVFVQSDADGEGTNYYEALRTVLRLHYVTAIECDHDAKTDTIRCNCSVWTGTPQPSVGAAVGEWVEHVMESLR